MTAAQAGLCFAFACRFDADFLDLDRRIVLQYGKVCEWLRVE
jgi:hypothetical protein